MSSEALAWYASIFLWLLFTGIGIPPVPEEAGIVYAATVTSIHPEVRWWLAWPATMAGIVAADMVLYTVGRFWGRRLFEYHWVNRIVPPERRRRLETRFHEHGIKILITARLLPPLRTGAFLIAGAIHYPFLRFVIADATYLIFGVGLFFFGSAWLVEVVHHASHWSAYAVAIGLVAAIWYAFHRQFNQRSLADPEAPRSILDLQSPSLPRPPSSSEVHEAATAPTSEPSLPSGKQSRS